jgi:hypothetical protein
MNKLIPFICAIGLCLACPAQEPRWTVSILPGYQFNTTCNRTETYSYYYYRREEKLETNFMGSVDLGLNLSEHYGLHFGYLVNNGKSSVRGIVIYNGDYHASPWDAFRAPVAIWEIGPEWDIRFSPKALLYFQFNLGRTASSMQQTYYDYYGNFREEPFRDNEWVYGAAVGFRFFFIPNAGIAAQVAYHRINGWPNSDMWDLRLGASFRF